MGADNAGNGGSTVIRLQNSMAMASVPVLAIAMAVGFWLMGGDDCDGVNCLETTAAELTSTESSEDLPSTTTATDASTQQAGQGTSLQGETGDDQLAVTEPGDSSTTTVPPTTKATTTTETSTTEATSTTETTAGSTTVASTTTTVATTAVTTTAETTAETSTTVSPRKAARSTSTAPATTAPTTTAAPTTAPDSSNQCGVIAFEAESVAVTGAWRIVEDGRASGGRYITWEGLSRERNNRKPADIISVPIRVNRAGEYRIRWAMRQPDDVAGDKANDSWLNFPDAKRFGPTDGGTYGGFVKVYGNSKGEFDYTGRADGPGGHTTVAIVFDNPGNYTMQIAGRSHGHQIDRVVLHHQSIKIGDAISGRAEGC